MSAMTSNIETESIAKRRTCRAIRFIDLWSHKVLQKLVRIALSLLTLKTKTIVKTVFFSEELSSYKYIVAFVKNYLKFKWT